MKRFLSTFVFILVVLLNQGCYTQLKWFHSSDYTLNDIDLNYYNEDDYLDYQSEIIYDNSLFSYDLNKFNRTRNNFFGLRKSYHYPFWYSYNDLSYWDRNSYYLGSGYGFYSPYVIGYENTFYHPLKHNMKPVYSNNQSINNFESRKWYKRSKSISENNQSSNLKTIRFSNPSMTKTKQEKKNRKKNGTFKTVNSKHIPKRPNVIRSRDNYPSSRDSYSSPRRNAQSSSSSSSESSTKRVSRRR